MLILTWCVSWAACRITVSWCLNFPAANFQPLLPDVRKICLAHHASRVLAVEHLVCCGVERHDVKPENVFVSKPKVQVSHRSAHYSHVSVSCGKGALWALWACQTGVIEDPRGSFHPFSDVTLLDLCVSSLRRRHANLLCNRMIPLGYPQANGNFFHQ